MQNVFTAHKRIEQILMQNVFAAHKRKYLAMIAEQANEGIAVVNLDGSLRFVDETWVGMHGSPDTAIKDLGATIEGSKYGATNKDPLPQMTAPTDLFYMGTAIDSKGSTVTIGPADSGT